MAAKAKEPETGAAPGGQDASLITIEALAITHKTRAAVFAGVCAAKGWQPGKAVTTAEYLAAVDTFMKGPVHGNPKESEAKK